MHWRFRRVPLKFWASAFFFFGGGGRWVLWVVRKSRGPYFRVLLNFHYPRPLRMCLWKNRKRQILSFKAFKVSADLKCAEVDKFNIQIRLPACCCYTKIASVFGRCLWLAAYMHRKQLKLLGGGGGWKHHGCRCYVRLAFLWQFKTDWLRLLEGLVF